MGGVIAILKAVLGLDTKEYKANIRDAVGATKGLKEALSSVAQTLGISFTVAGVIAATKSVIEFASQIRDTAANLNISTDSLQGLNAVAMDYGVHVDQIGQALAKLTEAQNDVVQSASAHKEALKALNIDATQFVNLGVDEALARLGQGYNEAADKGAAFAAIAELIGSRAAPRMVAMLSAVGKEGLQAVIDKSKEAGTSIEQNLLARLDELGDRNDKMILRMKVQWASLLDVVHHTAAAISAVGNLRGKDVGTLSPLERARKALAAIGGPPEAPVPETPPRKPGSGDRGNVKPEDQARPGENTPLEEARLKNLQELRKLQALPGANFIGEELALKAREAQREQRAALRTLQARWRDMSGSVVGDRLRTDALAAVGGSIGPSRGVGYQAADRQLRLQHELVSLAREARSNDRTRNVTLAEIAANTSATGGGGENY